MTSIAAFGHKLVCANGLLKGFHYFFHFVKYKERNNRPSSVNLKPIVHKHNNAENKCHTQDATDTRETQVCE